MSHSKNYSIKRSVFAAANRVWAELSCGHDKPVYMDALEAEFSRVGCLHAERAPAIPVYYKGKKLQHTGRRLPPFRQGNSLRACNKQSKQGSKDVAIQTNVSHLPPRRLHSKFRQK